MSGTQRTLLNLRGRLHIALCSRRLCVRFLSIAGKRKRRTVFTLCCAFFTLVLLVTLVFAFRTPTETQSVKVIEPPVECRVRLANPPIFETEAFYQTIIDNNLFRPLGWTPPRPVEPYRLLGIILPTDEKTPPQAIIQVSTAGNKTHIVNISDTLDADTKVVDIQPKQVVLDRQDNKPP